MLWGSIVAAVFAVIVATQIFASDVAQTFRIGRRGAVSGYDFSLSFALLAIGHLCGLSVGIAMLIGACIGWGWGVPHFSALAGDLTTAAGALAQTTWSHKVRFLGAGAIGVSAIWTLFKLVKPVASWSHRRDGRVARAQGRQSRHAADHRARYSHRHCRHRHTCLHVADRLGARLLRNNERTGRAFGDAGDRRRGLRLSHELLRFGGVRLHGGADRFVEQPALRHRHSRGDRRCAAACRSA